MVDPSFIDTCVGAAACGTLVVIYPIILYKACKGTRFKLIIGQIVMLFFANLSYLVFIYLADFVNPRCAKKKECNIGVPFLIE
jgi:hypothetical protein